MIVPQPVAAVRLNELLGAMCYSATAPALTTTLGIYERTAMDAWNGQALRLVGRKPHAQVMYCHGLFPRVRLNGIEKLCRAAKNASCALLRY